MVLIKPQSYDNHLTDCIWSIDKIGEPVNDPACVGILTYVPPGPLEVQYQALDTSTQKTAVWSGTIAPAHRTVVILGDSYFSGEGVPDHTDQTRAAHWMDHRCHRSLFAGPLLAVARVALEERGVAWTTITLACSGATITEGVLGSYDGIEDVAYINQFADARKDVLRVPTLTQLDGQPLAPQWEAARSALCGYHPQCPNPIKADFVFVSVGGNDIGFASIATDLLTKNVTGVTKSMLEDKFLKDLSELRLNLPNVLRILLANLGTENIYFFLSTLVL